MAFLSLTTKQQEDIENILNLWIGKVTWALLVKRIEFKLDVVTTRQTLAKYPTISRAYEESKLRSRSKGMSLQEVTNFTKSDIELIETLITTNSWWDTVDFISKQILGVYLTQFPEAIEIVIDKFSAPNNMWLNRSTLLFQLGYKNKTDQNILFAQCLHFKESELFFIQKAIGWSLREYGKTNPEAVLNFVNINNLKPLSHKEAIRNIIK